jgi:hypothetical protein
MGRSKIHHRLSVIIAFEIRRFMTDKNLKMVLRTDGYLVRESWRGHQGAPKLLATRVIQQLIRDNDAQNSIEKALGLRNSLADSFALRTTLEDRIRRWGQPYQVHAILPAEWESAKTLPKWTPVISAPSVCQELLSLLQSSVSEHQDEEKKVQDDYKPSIWHELQTLQPVTAMSSNDSDGSKEHSLGNSHSYQYYENEWSGSSGFVLKDALSIYEAGRNSTPNASEYRTYKLRTYEQTIGWSWEEDDILRQPLQDQ